MVILKMAGRRLIRLRKKLVEFVTLDDVIDNWKLAGSISSRIITGLRYKPNEVIQVI